MLFFLFLETKEAVEVTEASEVIMSVEGLKVIEASEVFRTTQSLKINTIKDRITLFWCFEKEIFLNKTPENFSEILHSLITEAVEDRDIDFNQIKGS